MEILNLIQSEGRLPFFHRWIQRNHFFNKTFLFQKIQVLTDSG